MEDGVSGRCGYVVRCTRAASPSSFAGYEPRHFSCDAQLVGIRELREHRERHDCCRDSFTDREFTSGVTVYSACLLKMQWNWVVNTSSDAAIVQVGYECIPSFGAHHVQMVDRTHCRIAPRQRKRSLLTKEFTICLRTLPPLRIPPWEVL